MIFASSVKATIVTRILAFTGAVLLAATIGYCARCAAERLAHGMIFVAPKHQFVRGYFPNPAYVTFTLWNPSFKTIRINGVRGICGCSVNMHGSAMVCPREHRPITIRIQPSFVDQHVHKSIDILTDEQEQNVHCVYIDATFYSHDKSCHRDIKETQ
jgi:hypothetical protein